MYNEATGVIEIDPAHVHQTDGAQYVDVLFPGTLTPVRLILEKKPGYGWMRTPPTSALQVVYNGQVHQWIPKGHGY